MKSETYKLKRTKNTIRNIATGLINRIVQLVLPFIVRTVLIREMGLEYVGLNGLFSSILEVLNLSELGIGSAIVYCMYKPISEDDNETLCALLNIIRKAYFIIGLCVAAIGIAICPFIKHFINGSAPEGVNIYLIYLVYLANSCISYLFWGYKSSLLSAYQRVDVINNISTLAKILLYGIQTVLIIASHNVYYYVLAIPFITVVINAITGFQVKRLYPNVFCKGEPDQIVKNEIKEKVSGLVITKLCYVTRNSFDSVFISMFLGLALNAVYSNYYYIMHAVTVVLGIIIQSMLAGIGNSIHTEFKEQNFDDFIRFNFMYIWISSVCANCLLCLYQPFMLLWMGEDCLLPISSVILFCMYFFMLTIGDMQGAYYNAAGLWHHYRIPTIIESMLNLVLNYVLGKRWGLNGIIAGTLISLFAINFLYSERLIFKFYFQNNKERIFYSKQFKYIITALISCGISYLLCNKLISNVNISLIPNMIMRAIICFIVSNCICFVVNFKSEEFKSAKKWLREKCN